MLAAGLIGLPIRAEAGGRCTVYAAGHFTDGAGMYVSLLAMQPCLLSQVDCRQDSLTGGLAKENECNFRAKGKYWYESNQSAL